MKNKGLLHPQLVGINGASTFTGFCSVHDDKLFAPVEKYEFTATQEQCFMLAYRAYAREMFTKNAAVESAKNHVNMDRGRPAVDQMDIQAFAAVADIGLQAALKDIDHHRPRFEAPLLASDYSSVRSYVITFGDPPPVMCSATFGPEQDFDGNELQDIADLSVIPQLMSVTSFYGGQHGHVVFTWLPEDDDVCLKFINSLATITDKDLSSALIRLMFEFFENLHIAPSWWDSLLENQRMTLIKRMSASANPMQGRSPNCLKNDNWTVAPWTVLDRKWIGASISPTSASS